MGKLRHRLLALGGAVLVAVLGLLVISRFGQSAHEAGRSDTPTALASPTPAQPPPALVTTMPTETEPTVSRKSANPGAPRRAVHYVFPVAGCRTSYISSHHDYPATDIIAPAGCRFVAPVD